MKKFLPVIYTFILILFSSSSFAQEKTADQPVKKVYAVYLTDMRGTSYIVEDLQSVDFLGVKCLKGTASKLPGWVKDTTALYFPVDKIQSVLEYNSLKDYKESDERYSKKQLEE